MKKLNGVFAILLMALCITAQQKPKAEGPKFDVADFNKKFETVRWLVEYDNVAWKTTDVLMTLDESLLERLGQEWFCFQDKAGMWHAVYGKLTAGKYDVVVHFVMDAAGKISKSEAKVDQTFVDSHAVALATGRAKLMAAIPEGSPRFNQFVKQNNDKSFTVWLFPAFQPNRMAVFGGEAIYQIDTTGTKITKDESYFQKGFRGFMSEPAREVWLTYREHEKPSLGAIFFVWYYKQYFTQIFIDNARSTSTVIKAGDSYLWTHIEKDQITPK